MVSTPHLDAILVKVKEMEVTYHWIEAAKYSKQALVTNSSRGIFVAEIWEKLDFYYTLSPRQAKTLVEFQKTR